MQQNIWEGTNLKTPVNFKVCNINFNTYRPTKTHKLNVNWPSTLIVRLAYKLCWVKTDPVVQKGGGGWVLTLFITLAAPCVQSCGRCIGHRSKEGSFVFKQISWIRLGKKLLSIQKGKTFYLWCKFSGWSVKSFCYLLRKLLIIRLLALFRMSYFKSSFKIENTCQNDREQYIQFVTFWLLNCFHFFLGWE